MSVRPVRALRVSDHALLRFLERAGGLDVEALRAQLAGSLARADDVARRVDKRHYRILADGVIYVVRDCVVVTVLPLRPRTKILGDAELGSVDG